MIILLISILAGYLIGAIPTSYILVKIKTGKDIRRLGSGNPGATNVGRILGKKWGILVLFFDMIKGFLPVWGIFYLVFYIKPDNLLFSKPIIESKEIFKTCIGLSAITGHIFPLYLDFKGGKGVATTLGVFLALVPIPLLITALIMIIIISLTGYISVGSIAGAIILPVILILKQSHIVYIILGIMIGLLIIYRHISNIKRLLIHTESKFSIKK